MFQRKTSSFRRRPNGRSHTQRNRGGMQSRMRPGSFSNGPRNNFRPALSAEKLLEKYNTLAKEAMSSGDKTLSENYLQHADHFMRIIEDKNKNQNQNKTGLIEKVAVAEKDSSENSTANKEPALDNKE